MFFFQVPTDESTLSIEIRALNHEMVATMKVRGDGWTMVDPEGTFIET